MDRKLLVIGLVAILLLVISSGAYATGFHRVIKSADGEILQPPGPAEVEEIPTEQENLGTNPDTSFEEPTPDSTPEPEPDISETDIAPMAASPGNWTKLGEGTHDSYYKWVVNDTVYDISLQTKVSSSGAADTDYIYVVVYGKNDTKIKSYYHTAKTYQDDVDGQHASYKTFPSATYVDYIKVNLHQWSGSPKLDMNASNSFVKASPTLGSGWTILAEGERDAFYRWNVNDTTPELFVQTKATGSGSSDTDYINIAVYNSSHKQIASYIHTPKTSSSDDVTGQHASYNKFSSLQDVSYVTVQLHLWAGDPRLNTSTSASKVVWEPTLGTGFTTIVEGERDSFYRIPVNDTLKDIYITTNATGSGASDTDFIRYFSHNKNGFIFKMDNGPQTTSDDVTGSHVKYISYYPYPYVKYITVQLHQWAGDPMLQSGSSNITTGPAGPDNTNPTIGTPDLDPNPVTKDSTINISINVTDAYGISTVLFRIDNGTYVSPTGSSGTNYWYTGANTSVLGNHTIDIWANDTSGNNNSLTGTIYTVNVNPVTIGPVINSVTASPSPVNRGTPITLTANVTDNIGVGTVTFNIGGTNYTASGSSGDLYWYTGASTASIGTFSFTVYANDTDGNWATPLTGNYTVQSSSADTTAPVVTLVAPPNSSVDTDGTVTFTYTANDYHGGVASAKLIIDGSVVQTDTNVTEGVNQTFTATLFSGNHTWSINATDDSTNANQGRSATWSTGVSVPYGMYLNDPADQSVKVKTTATYTITINNIGLNNDTYSLNLNNTDSITTAVLSASSISVPAVSSSTFTLTVMGMAKGDYDVDVSAVSTTNATVSDTITITTTVTPSSSPGPGPSGPGGGTGTTSKRYNTTIKAEIEDNTSVPPEDIGDPRYLDIGLDVEGSVAVDAGTQKTIPVTVQNLGNVRDVLGISVSGKEWATLSEGQFSLEPGESRHIELVLSPPADEKDIHELTISVQSMNFGAEGSATAQTMVDVVEMAGRGGPTGFAMLFGGSWLIGLAIVGLILALYALWYQTSRKKSQIAPEDEADELVLEATEMVKTEEQLTEAGLEEEYQRALSEQRIPSSSDILPYY